MTASDDKTDSSDSRAIAPGGRPLLVAVHGLLGALGAYALLSVYAETGSPYALLMVPALLLFHGTLYWLRPRSVTRPEVQRVLIVIGVSTTAFWFLLFAVQSRLGYFSLVAVGLAIPLVWQRLSLWFAVTAGALGFALMAVALGWTQDGMQARMTEASILVAAVLVWILYAFLFEHSRNDEALSLALAREEENVRVMEQMSRSLAAAEDVAAVFSVATTTLRDLFGCRQCQLSVVDPVRWTGSIVAVENESDQHPGETLDLTEDSPLRAILQKEVTVHTDRSSGITIPLDTGFGLLHVISCQADQGRIDGNGMTLLEGIAETIARTMRNVQLFDQTRERAQTDALTGLPNRGSFQSMVRREFDRAKRHGRPLSLLMVDLDHLKTINDRFGHPMGDIAIREVADRIMAVLRGSDHVAARYGGEEFCVILPETEFEGALQVGQRICNAIAENPLPTVGQITASVGVATYPLNAISKDELIESADQALYKAKRGGRNRVAASEMVLLGDPPGVGQPQ